MVEMIHHQDPPPRKDLLPLSGLLLEYCQPLAVALSDLPQLQTHLALGHVFSQGAHVPQGRAGALTGPSPGRALTGLPDPPRAASVCHSCLPPLLPQPLSLHPTNLPPSALQEKCRGMWHQEQQLNDHGWS